MAEYEKIAADLRRRIRGGEFTPGARLPSEDDLKDQTRKSGPTVRQALDVLVAEGLIEKRHGVGTFVRKPRKLISRTNLRHQWEKDRAREAEAERKKTGATEHDTGLEIDDLVFTAKYREIKADERLAGVFGIPEGADVVERTYRTRYSSENAPFALVTSHLVRDIVAANPDLLDDSKEPWPGGTMNQLHSVGIELDRVEEHVTARPPTVEESEELDLPRGTAVLALRKTSIDTDGRVVEYSDVILPGDRTELLFTTSLKRW